MSEDDETRRGTKRPKDWTPEENLRAVMEASSSSDAELGAWLRRNGIKEEHLRQWRRNPLPSSASTKSGDCCEC